MCLFKNTRNLLLYSQRHVSRVPKQLGVFHDFPELSKRFKPPTPFEPLFYPILELKRGKVEDRIQAKEFEFTNKRREPEPYLGKYTTLLQIPDDNKWAQDKNVVYKHTKVYVMGVEKNLRDDTKFSFETLEEMEKVLKMLQPDVVAVEAFALTAREFDVLDGRRLQYVMERHALTRYSTILEKASRLGQHVALIDRPTDVTLLRLWKNAEFFMSKKDLYIDRKLTEMSYPKLFDIVYLERELCMTFALQRLAMEVTRKKAMGLKTGDKLQPTIILAFVDKQHMIGISEFWKERIQENEVVDLTDSPKSRILRYVQKSSKLANWISDTPILHAYYTVLFARIAVGLLALLLSSLPIALLISIMDPGDINDPAYIENVEKREVQLRKVAAVCMVVIPVVCIMSARLVPKGAY